MKKPGIYPDLTMEEYHSAVAISSTAVRKAMRSIDHLNAYLSEDHKSTAAQELGTAIHSAVLEPDDFKRIYIDSKPPVDVGEMYYRHRQTAELLAKGKDVPRAAEAMGVKEATASKYAKLKEVQKLRVHYLRHPPESAPNISNDDLGRAMGAASAVLTHPTASKIIASGNAEISHFWRDEETGLVCRCRPDSKIDDGILVDLKSTTDARPRACQREIFKWGYHVQAAFYLDGVSATERSPFDRFVFIFVETKAPYGVRVYELSAEAIQRGRDEYRATLAAIAEYRDGGKQWTGYPTHIETIDLPSWA